MLELVNIKKHYVVANKPIPALKGLNLTFKDQEFVSILGPSGCGKTTLLNLIGGLDRYSSGDLMLDGKSTKSFTDQDWDAYRNATIGFVFQSYNLISHLTVLDNVEMALRLSGVSQKVRRAKATKLLHQVGLDDQIHKKPNQLSGGQMQRVAIARALINDPKILLADEPTGALDTHTSDQIMKLIKSISKNILVIMVTHNPDIAEEYSDRVIQLLDGVVTEDSSPVEAPKHKQKRKLFNRKTSMSYLTALQTSFNNLLTKMGRTLITALAGSIGIVGISLVLAVSEGMTIYVDDMQDDTLAGYPITISPVATDFIQMGGGPGFIDDGSFPEEPLIYSYDPAVDSANHVNLITTDYVNYVADMDPDLYNSISYTQGLEMNVLSRSLKEYHEVSYYFHELPRNNEFVASQFDLLAGTFPESETDVVIVVDDYNRLNVDLLENMGFDYYEYDFNDLLNHEFKVIPNDLYYQNSNNVYSERGIDKDMYESNDAITLRVVGIIRGSQEATADLVSMGIGYTGDLTDRLLNIAENSIIVSEQERNHSEFVIGNVPFNSRFTYEDAMIQLGGDTIPVGIQIYPKSFEDKDDIKAYLDDYNDNLREEDQIVYLDMAELVSNTIGSLINTITIILSAFAGISLVVSSIMIGIITYVSVVERTKEIGIMRSLGARKKDISRIFNAETVIIGFTAGVLGVLIAALMTIPINGFLANLIDVEGFSKLPVTSAVILVILSTILTLISGIIPSRIAAKKDPVVALRTE